MRKHKEGFGCIYKLTNLFNDDSYIGKDKTGDPENHRWKHHLKMAEKGGGSYIHNAIFDYDFQFSAEVIWRGPVVQLNWKETYYIKKYHTFVDDPKYKGGYNLTPGGDGQSVGYKPSDKTRALMSASLRRLYEDPAEREKQSVAQARAYEDLTVRERHSAANRRRYEDPAERAKTSAEQLRRWENKAERKKLSAALRIYWADAQAHVKASAALYKRYEDPAERKKTSDAGKRYYEDPVAHMKTSKASKRVFAKKTPEERKAFSKAGVAARRSKAALRKAAQSKSK